MSAGHSRQGWKCRLCKINVHTDCKNGVGRCLPKSRLLRRQKSGSELLNSSSYVSDVGSGAINNSNSGIHQFDDDGSLMGDVINPSDAIQQQQQQQQDPTYIVLKQAGELASATNATGSVSRRRCPPPPLDVAPLPDQQHSSGSSEMVSGGSGGVISRPPRTNNLIGGGGRRPNPNTLSVGEPSAFHPSTSGKFHIKRTKQNGSVLSRLVIEMSVTFVTLE